MKILKTSITQVPVQTRIPFKYGIATLTDVPYTYVQVTMEIDRHTCRGMAADVLPPKWFTKIPEKPLDEEFREMLEVIQNCCNIAANTPAEDSVFDLWQNIYDQQADWGERSDYPPLLSAFGASLIERAVIDCFCRNRSCTFSQALQENAFGIRLGLFHDSLSGTQPADYLPSSPTGSMTIRHTIGMADPLLDTDISPSEKLADGLPHSLEENIRQYGLTHFKIKLPADLENALARLQAIASIVQSNCHEYAFTMDGNEFFNSISSFRDYWDSLSTHESVAPFLQQGLIAVEQPLHRDFALEPQVQHALQDWTDRPRLIIDESDGQNQSFALALECGYSGTSHKNCKGVFKGVANACKVVQENLAGGNLIMTGEDLMNIGPVALLQDLAVGAALGLNHMERNGHHYVAGLSPFPKAIQDQMLVHHSDLYRAHQGSAEEYPTLRIEAGTIQLGSVNDSPFGYRGEMMPK